MPDAQNDSMDEVLQSLVGGFREEARELLCDMEAALMELEERPDDGELVARAFRALHTIKGNGAMFGLAELERFAHDLEHVFDLLRKGKMPVSSEIIDLALGAKDRLLTLLETDGDSAEECRLREVDRRRIARLLAGRGATAPTPLETREPGRLSAGLLAAFKEEARDLLHDLEGALLALEATPDDEELITRAFQALHTIKGNAGIFGYVELEAFAHEIECVFEELQTRKMPVTRGLIDRTLEARDHILQLLLGAGGDDPGSSRQASENKMPHPIAEIRSADRLVPMARVWRLLFKPPRRLFADGTDPLVVFAELRTAGEWTVKAQFGAVPALEEIDPAACYLSWEILFNTNRTPQEILDAFIFIGGDNVLEITPVEFGAEFTREIQERAAADELPANSECGPAVAASGAIVRVRGAIAEAALRKMGETATTLRVATAKLDKLVDLVGELVTVQARLSLVASLRTDPELLGVAEDVERLTAALRDQSLNVRMVPIGPSFGKFRRLVRDLSHEIGHEVELTTAGEETELDKNVIDRLNDPIVHLLRNSIDHGIEPRAQRLRSGKPARGRVRLSAAYAGANVVIRVEDDGAGIDTAAVRQRAVEHGLIGESDQRTERELHALMFLPGFSTSAQVTKVSGRGVGLDVVKRTVEALSGRIHVQSRSGEGTVIEIRIPLTLAIIEGLDVVLGGDHLILPLGNVKECVELVRRPGDDGRERSLAEIRGELVPYVRLREWFQVPGTAPAREQIVVTETDDQRVGLVVDQVVGGQQTVIKPLGPLFKEVRGLAGATILGDGNVALILDVVQLVKHIERADAERSAPA